MIPGSLTDLDPAAAPERRWPFYLAWTMGGLVVGAVMLSHLPVSLVHVPVPVAASAQPAAPAPTVAPAPLRQVNPLPVLPQGSPSRVVPLPIAPPRP
jgi:hypothetical protein